MLCNIQERDAYLVNVLHTAEEAEVVAALSSSHLPLGRADVLLRLCDRCWWAQVRPSPPCSHFGNPSLVEAFQILLTQQQWSELMMKMRGGFSVTFRRPDLHMAQI